MDVLALAFGADLGDAAFESAVVALELMVALVMGDRDGAVLALHGWAAGPAEHYRRVAAAVEQDHRLLTPGETLADGLCQSAGKEDSLFFVLLLEFGAHVEDLDLGKRPLLDALAQFDQLIFSALRVVVGLERRRRRAEY